MKEETRQSIFMEIAVAGIPGANLLYTLGPWRGRLVLLRVGQIFTRKAEAVGTGDPSSSGGEVE